MENAQILALWFTFGLISVTCAFVAYTARKDSKELRDLCRDLSKLATSKVLKDRIDSVGGVVENHGLTISELRGNVNSLEQTLKSHLQRYYKLQRDERKEEEEQELQDIFDQNMQNLQPEPELSSFSNAHAATRKLGW